MLFLFWLHFCILSWVIFPLFSSSILGTYWPGSSFSVLSFCLFILFRDWARTVLECLLWRYGSAVACHRGRGSERSRRGLWPKCSWRRSPLLHHRASRTYTKLGKQTLGGHKQKLCAPGPRRWEQWPQKRLTQTFLWVFRSLWQRRGPVVACCRVGDTQGSSACMGPFEGDHHYLHYLHHSLTSHQTTRSEHNPAHQQKIELKIYWAWPCLSEQDSVFPSVSLSHQEASISFLSLYISGPTEWKPQSQKTNQTDHMDHSLF